MLATLCAYENRFGPYHPYTLRLAVMVAEGLDEGGDAARARRLLERTARDLDGVEEPAYELEMLVRSALRDVLTEQRDFVSAGAVQRRIVEATAARFGSDHAETSAERSRLEDLLFHDAACPAA